MSRLDHDQDDEHRRAQETGEEPSDQELPDRLVHQETVDAHRDARGIRTARVPDPAITPVESSSGYPIFRMTGREDFSDHDARRDGRAGAGSEDRLRDDHAHRESCREPSEPLAGHVEELREEAALRPDVPEQREHDDHGELVLGDVVVEHGSGDGEQLVQADELVETRGADEEEGKPNREARTDQGQKYDDADQTESP